MTTAQLQKIKIACQKTDFKSKLTTFIDGVQYAVDNAGEVGLTEQSSPDGWSRDELIRIITAIPLSVLKDDGEYFKAGDNKRFVAFRWDNGVALLSIREDGDTRTVFSGTITAIADFKKVWQLTI